jgi:hypothetical protein
MVSSFYNWLDFYLDITHSVVLLDIAIRAPKVVAMQPPHVTDVSLLQRMDREAQENNINPYLDDNNHRPTNKSTSAGASHGKGASKALELFQDTTSGLLDDLGDIHSSIKRITSGVAVGGGVGGRNVGTPERKDTSHLRAVPEYNEDTGEGARRAFTLHASAQQANDKAMKWHYVPMPAESAATPERPGDERELPNSPNQTKELHTIAQLIKENKMLKAEMSQFDTEFFEELEDLKYRYSKLQQVVGELPPKSTYRAQSPLRPAAADSPSKATGGSSPLPLNRCIELREIIFIIVSWFVVLKIRLSWAARRSMTAIDKASLNSSLMGNRPSYDQGRDSSDEAFAASRMAYSYRGDPKDTRPFPYTSAVRDSAGYDDRLDDSDRYYG